MNVDELNHLLTLEESSRVERTLSTGDMDKFQEAICAFSNDLSGARPTGYLLIGVRDDGQIGGLSVDDNLQKKIASIRSNGNILPLPLMKTEKVATPQGDVLVVAVEPSLLPPCATEAERSCA